PKKKPLRNASLLLTTKSFVLKSTTSSSSQPLKNKPLPTQRDAGYSTLRLASRAPFHCAASYLSSIRLFMYGVCPLGSPFCLINEIQRLIMVCMFALTSKKRKKEVDSMTKARPNHSMKPTSPFRNKFSVFATTRCRGLLLSR